MKVARTLPISGRPRLIPPVVALFLAACSASAATQPEQRVASGLDIVPPSASVRPGRMFQLPAEDSAGNVLTGQSVSWSSSNSSVASVDGAGLVTGQATGSATITATSGGVSGTATVTVASSSSTGSPDLSVGGGANEPSGMTRIAEWDVGWEYPPNYQSPSDPGCLGSNWTDQSLYGRGTLSWANSKGDYSNIRLIDDPTAPVSGPEVMYYRWEAGHVLKTGLPPNIWIWSVTNPTSCPVWGVGPYEEYNEVYVSMYTKYHVEDGGPAIGNGKLFHIKPHFTLNSWNSIDDYYPTAFGVDARIIWTDNSGTVHTDVIHQNDEKGGLHDTGSRLLTIEHWHHTEWYMKANTLQADGTANADGVFKVWIDGTLVINYSNIRMRSGKDPAMFDDWYDGNTLGTRRPGVTTVDVPQGRYYDHVYVSGKKP
jgi:hypothetical protein